MSLDLGERAVTELVRVVNVRGNVGVGRSQVWVERCDDAVVGVCGEAERLGAVGVGFEAFD